MVERDGGKPLSWSDRRGAAGEIAKDVIRLAAKTRRISSARLTQRLINAQTVQKCYFTSPIMRLIRTYDPSFEGSA